MSIDKCRREAAGDADKGDATEDEGDRVHHSPPLKAISAANEACVA